MSWSRSYESGYQNGGVFDAKGQLVVALQDDFLLGQWELQKQIVARELELGIGAVLPAFSGKVPGQLKRLFPRANMTGSGKSGPAWVDATDPLFKNISRLFLSKQIRDFGRTGFYEADGYFAASAAPWASPRPPTPPPPPLAASSAKLGHEYPSVSAMWKPASYRARVSRASATSAPCQYAAVKLGVYILGEASAGIQDFKTLADATAACNADDRCGGVTVEKCTPHSTRCAGPYRTRSGMSSAGCHAGVPCPGDVPKVVKCPPGTDNQNSYVITNAAECGHSPSENPGGGGSAPGNGESARAHASAVYGVMQELDPDAVWVYQGWPWMRTFITGHPHPTAAGVAYMSNFTHAVPMGKLVMLDMRSEAEPIAGPTQSFYNTSFVWEAMDDFGGTNGMFGDVGSVQALIAARRNDVAFSGTGISMEGIDQNPVYYEAVLDALWPVNHISESHICNIAPPCQNGAKIWIWRVQSTRHLSVLGCKHVSHRA